jgi:signal transduction histidine kinase
MLAETLEQQTAIAEILRTISQSPTEIQPVFETILENACRLCEADLGFVMTFDGECYHTVAFRGGRPAFIEFMTKAPLKPEPGTGLHRLIHERQPIHITDLKAEEAYRSRVPQRMAVTDLEGARTLLLVPLLKDDTLIGGIWVYRRQMRPFTSEQIEMVRTFADQGSIAIENGRLFEELQAQTEALARSVGEFKALGEVGQAVSSTLDLQTVLTTIITRAVQLSGAHAGVVHEYSEVGHNFHIRADYGVEENILRELQETPIPLGESAMGQAGVTRTAVQVPDLEEQGSVVVPTIRSVLAKAGYRSLLAVPLLLEDRIMGGLALWRREPGGFAEEVVNLLQTLATQSTLAIQNARLFFEIEERGSQLEIASRHKSQFLANMSHELRTPLNAIIGFTRLVLRKTEAQIPALQAENLNKVLTSAKHLLDLINDILDLSKIEAGQLEISMETFKLDDLIHTAASTMEPMLKEGQVRLIREIEPEIPLLHTDRQKVRQIVLNLLSNAVKFTERGEVKISAWRKNDSLRLAVSDTGIGMEKEALNHIFEEFRQADMSTTRKYGGTGLGLAIARKLVDLLNGDISVESAPGEGTTFIVTLPFSLEGLRGKASE